MKQLAAAAVVLLLGLGCQASKASRNASSTQAIVAKVEGTTEFLAATQAPGTGWQTLRLGQNLGEGDQARTGADGRADIRLSPYGGVMSLEPNSTLQIEQLGPRGTNKQSVAVVRLTRGRVTGDTLKLPKDFRVTVKTGAGTFAIP